MENIPDICEGVHDIPAGCVDERQEELMFKYYSEILSKAKHSFPLEHLLNYFNSNDIKRFMLTSQSERNYDRKSFVAKQSITKIPQFDFIIVPCQCIVENSVYKLWMKQLYVKLLQRIDYDSYYKFFIHNENIGIVTNFGSDLKYPLFVCFCGKCEWNIDRDKIHLFTQSEIWITMNLQNQIIYRNGAMYAMIGRQFIKSLKKQNFDEFYKRFIS